MQIILSLLRKSLISLKQKSFVGRYLCGFAINNVHGLVHRGDFNRYNSESGSWEIARCWTLPAQNGKTVMSVNALVALVLFF